MKLLDVRRLYYGLANVVDLGPQVLSDFKQRKNRRQSKNSRLAHELLRGRSTPELSNEDREKVKEIVKEERSMFFFYSDPGAALNFGVFCVYMGLVVSIMNWCFSFASIFDEPERRITGRVSVEKPD